ncbi:MAG: NAD(P)H-hydrate dehydratase, partial [Lachnospiraceae bacterium]
ASEMKQMDENTTMHYGILPAVLMERAALQVVSYITTCITTCKPKDLKVLVVAGTGNNGGDGLAIGRLLMLQGYKVDLVLLGDKTHCSEETKRQLQICYNYKMHMMGKIAEREYDIVIDAIFGIGLNRIVEGIYAEAIEQMNHMTGTKLAVDMPSGIHTDSGLVMGTAVEADVTITFAYKKIGQLLYPGARYCGTLLCKDIGITIDSYLGKRPLMYSYQTDDIDRLPKRNPAGNKGSFGKLLLVAGSVNMSGACILSGLSAYRTGTGLVRIITPQENQAIIQKMLPEAIVMTYDKKSVEDSVNWCDCMAIGPGIGIMEPAQQILEYLMKQIQKPLLIDADGLNILSENRILLQEIKNRPHLIMTPHMAEFSRLLQISVTDLKQDILTYVKRFVKEYGVTLVCKDARTICCTGEQIYVNQSGNDGMATAGSGDVLTGIIAGLLSQHMDCGEAAVLGVYLHGLAGDRALLTNNRYSLIARDIIEQLRYLMSGRTEA